MHNAQCIIIKNEKLKINIIYIIQIIKKTTKWNKNR